MSTRFYPRFVKGNPQLRIFLPDWTLIPIKPKERQPKNVVLFKTDVRMTDWDIKSYLEKIYKVPVAGIRSDIRHGDLRASSKGITKTNDYRLAHVTLTADQTFEWPDLFPREKAKEQTEDYEKTLKELTKERKQDPNQRGLPTWFS